MNNELSKMPVILVGHGSPENSIEDNEFTRGWKKKAELIPKPKAILCISTHWKQPRTAVIEIENPRTMNDFYGFADELYRIDYRVKGSESIAENIVGLIKSVNVSLDYKWGLDHETWSVLAQMYPEKDIPVLQLSLEDFDKPIVFSYCL